ncbi:MAG: DoxX family membrane protein [Fidelibacterota bacterium]|jgi:putative oxidoreductase|tara:strand:+ start:9666 stop:10172 length:507 start_codon:yes stop_codon:yes gene_type:complete
MKRTILKLTILFLSSLTIICAQSVAERYGDRISLLGMSFKDPLVLCQILIAIFISIVFIQSGLDKVLNRRNNLEYFKVQFSKSIFNKVYPILLSILTILELVGGLMLVYGIYFSFAEKTTLWIFYGLVYLAITMIFLLLGQRIAKDYVGAADLVPYFILIILGIMSMY